MSRHETPAERDARAALRDRAAEARDRDWGDGDATDEHAAMDRLHAAEDRLAARADRRAAADDRAGLERAVEGRTIIGQAQGLLMATLEISAEEAFSLLVAESQKRNVKVLALAQERVDAHHQRLATRTG